MLYELKIRDEFVIGRRVVVVLGHGGPAAMVAISMIPPFTSPKQTVTNNGYGM
jgi:hypothetical protein